MAGIDQLFSNGEQSSEKIVAKKSSSIRRQSKNQHVERKTCSEFLAFNDKENTNA